MDFSLTPEQKMIVESVVRPICQKYDRSYWLEHARAGTFPHELWRELADSSLLGLNIPEAYGGQGLGLTETLLVQREMAEHGVPLLMLIVGPALSGVVIARHGTEEQKRRWLPPMVQGREIFAFSITEPVAGSNTFRTSTFARDDGDHYVLDGVKVFTSGADVADHLLVVARTAPYDREHRTRGISLLVVDRDSPGVHLSDLHLQVVHPEKQFMVTFDNVRVPKDNLIGEAGGGVRALFDGLNPERMMVAATCVGLGRYVLRKGVEYAASRVVFETAIGAHQALQHPLALARTHLELADWMNLQAAWRFDQGMDAGAQANMAKLAAADAAVEACEIAIQVHGGNAYAPEYDLMNLHSMIRVLKTAPVSREMILNYIGEHVLGLPKSY